MQKVVYPAVLNYDSNDKCFIFIFYDLNIVSTGLSVEQAYVNACLDVEAYFIFAQKFEFAYPTPTAFEELETNNKKVLLFDVNLSRDKVELTKDEEVYKKFISSMIE